MHGDLAGLEMEIRLGTSLVSPVAARGRALASLAVVPRWRTGAVECTAAHPLAHEQLTAFSGAKRRR